jgi:hypothetical protein
VGESLRRPPTSKRRLLAAYQLYVLPPDREMMIQNNRLHLRPCQRSRGGSRVMDTFFQSLLPLIKGERRDLKQVRRIEYRTNRRMD